MPIPTSTRAARATPRGCARSSTAPRRSACDAVVTIADDLDSARWVTRAAEWDRRVYAAVALHPTRANALDDAARAEIERLAAHPRVVAVGETGLDLYWPGRLDGCARAECAAGGLRLAYRPGQAVRQTADDPQPGGRRRVCSTCWRPRVLPTWSSSTAFHRTVRWPAAAWTPGGCSACPGRSASATPAPCGKPFR